MTTKDIAAALQRARAVLQRRPEAGLHADAPATALWKGGTRVVAQHDNGVQLPTDMPTELGGSGDQVTPGWLFRAGLASCAATSIALNAAREGIELGTLEVRAESRSDARGFLGMTGADGEPVPAKPGELQLRVRITAPGIAADRLNALVEAALSCSPIPLAVATATPYALHVDTEGGMN